MTKRIKKLSLHNELREKDVNPGQGEGEEEGEDGLNICTVIKVPN